MWTILWIALSVGVAFAVGFCCGVRTFDRALRMAPHFATPEMLEAGRVELMRQFKRWETEGVAEVRPVWDAMIAKSSETGRPNGL